MISSQRILKIKDEYEKKIKEYESMVLNANSDGQKKIKEIMEEMKKNKDMYDNEKKKLQEEMNNNRIIYNEEKEKLNEKLYGGNLYRLDFESGFCNYSFKNRFGLYRHLVGLAYRMVRCGLYVN